MALTTKYKQQLKAQAHPLKPVVLIGQHGVTDGVKKEIDQALNDHELIKVRMRTEDRDLRRTSFADICESLSAELVQLLGGIAIIYRKNEQQEKEQKKERKTVRKKASKNTRRR
jgi:RNA-binding protein